MEALRRLLFGVGAAGASEGASAEKEMRLAVGVAAISISGPAARLGEEPGERFAQQVVAAADQLSDLLARA